VQTMDEPIPRLPKDDVHVEEQKRSAPRVIKTAAPEKREKQTGKLKRQHTAKIKRMRQDDEQKADDARTAGGAEKAVRHMKNVLGWLGGMLLLLAMAGGEGLKKLGKQISGWKKGSGSRVDVHGHAPEREEYVLEAIRPEDYHGRAKSRSENMHHSAHGAQRKKAEPRQPSAAQRGGKLTVGGWKKLDMQRLISLALAGVAIFSFCMIVSILWRTVRTTRLNKQLTQMYHQAAVEETDESDDGVPTPEMVVFAPEETPLPQSETAEKTEETAEQQTPTDEQAETGYAEGDEEPIQPEETRTPEKTPLPMGKRTYHQVGGDALPQMEALHKENRDIVGWLRIENVLDLPVVYKDNSYYLTRDFYKQKNTAGTIFLDENHPFKEKTQNLLLHGHNMKDGTMFGRLIQYETDLNYVRWHPFVQFDTLWRKEEYVIFAVLRVSLDVKDDAFFNYFTHPTFASDSEFNSYIRQLQLRSLYAIPIDVKPEDALITLSTCLEDDRLVIVARRVRSGETHTDLRALTNLTTRQ